MSSKDFMRFISFVGIDEKTDIGELKRICFAFDKKVEFGFLYSKNTSGTGENNRYPDISLLDNYVGCGLPLSLHVCGGVARKIWSDNDWSILEEKLGDKLKLFSRIQLNIAREEAPKWLESGGWEFKPAPYKQQVIIQQTDDNPYVLNALWERGIHLGEKVCILFDSSGGTGVAGRYDGVNNQTILTGYAGGINFGNCCEAFVKVWNMYARSTKGDDGWDGRQFYLDLESGCRDSDNWFSTDLVWEICSEVFSQS